MLQVGCLRQVDTGCVETAVQYQFCAVMYAGDPDMRLSLPKPMQRQTLEAFVYDFFLFRFGVRLLAETHVAAVYDAVKRTHSESRRVATFARLLGIVEPLPEVRGTLTALHHPELRPTSLYSCQNIECQG